VVLARTYQFSALDQVGQVKKSQKKHVHLPMAAGCRGLPRQAYFEYDAKKSGGVTISHLRFGPQPIYAPQLGWTDAWGLPSWWHVPILLMVGWLMDADGCYTCYRWLTMAGWLMMDDG
jgi:hypothetical protein